ncbi:hypothetical protein GQ53DRAFT_881242 [Thozetella sp. PMI_491]|nr:hypothetical protein GQ53DRAFT_881242 [Thozetella sp. PMI_491]
MSRLYSATAAVTAVAFLHLSFAVSPAASLASTDTITWGGENSRAGYQTTHNMDPAIVASDQFARIFQTKLPGNYGNQLEQVYAQPLVYTPLGGIQYVYVSTTQNNVYKLNAKTGAIVASRNLHIPFLQKDLDNCYDVSPHIGIISTGVIDPTTDTLYLTAKTYENQTIINIPQGRPDGRWYIHALDVNTLEEKPGFPLNLEGIVARNSDVRTFNGGIQHQRPALLQVGEYIYIGFGSHCVQYEYTGWVIGFHRTTGKIVERFATEGQGVNNSTRGASLWMSGGGIASDGKSIFYATGNGFAAQLADTPVPGRNPPTSLEEAAVHMTINEDGSLNLVDFFMPYEKRDLDNADKDLGTSPLVLLPSQFSCGSVSRVGVVTGKSGKTYWLNLDDMGGYKNGPGGLDNVLQVYKNENVVYAGVGVYPLEGGYIYVNVIGYPTHVFKFTCTDGVPSWVKVADAPDKNTNALGVGHGTVTTLNDQPGTGLLWTSDTQGQTLKVYNAVPQNGTLKMIKSFSIQGVTKFTRPVFGDGIVYQGTRFGYFYGFGAPTKSPLNCSAPSYSFGTGEVGQAMPVQAISCKALAEVTISTISVDDSSSFSIANTPNLPVVVKSGQTVSFNATFRPSKVGALFANVIVQTNNITSYASKSAIRLTGAGQSSSAMLAIMPGNIDFGTVAVGSNGSKQSAILSNDGNANLTITSIRCSLGSSASPFVAANEVAPFTISGIPMSITARSQVAVDITFRPTAVGSYSLYIIMESSAGQQTLLVSASAGPAPIAKLEFQTTDGAGWLPYDPAVGYSFGDVLQGRTLNLKFRVTNIAPAGAVPLELTVSKPPLAVDGNILGAANLVDLAEGTLLAAGESATANMYCSPPKRSWNTDSYSRSVVWTMNTNGLNFGKHFIQFQCNAVAEQAPPLLSSGQGAYRYAGCHKEYNPGRQLDKSLYSGTLNTAASCLARCAAAGYKYCGMQYRLECWGGKTKPALQVDEANCNYVCSGDADQSCGGNGAVTKAVERTSSWNATSTIMPETFTSTPGPTTNPGTLGYDSIGCYSEANTGRALPNLVTTKEKTVASCIEACYGLYRFAGLEYYGNECWCGNSLTAAGVGLLDSSRCNRVCIDNAYEFCGGSLALNVYNASASVSLPVVPQLPQSVGSWELQGCYTDLPTARGLTGKVLMADTMTLELCASTCSKFAYFGTEYGRECYCGNSVASTSAKLLDPSECNMSCKGNKAQSCGSGRRLQVYKNPVVAGL